VTHNVEHWFQVVLPTTVDVQLCTEEHKNAVWLPRMEAIARCSSPSNRTAIEQFA